MLEKRSYRVGVVVPEAPGDGAHGKGALAAFAPHAVRGVQDAVFQSGIGLTRHAADPHSSWHEIIFFTSLKIPRINNGTGMSLPASL